MRRFSRGDLYFANLTSVVGSEQGGFRPVLILQNDVGNDKSRLKRFIGTMDADCMEEIDRALGVSVGLAKLSMSISERSV